MINLAVVQLFVRIAECGGIAPAAREFGLAPSVASRQVAALERSLGTKLLIRTTRHLSLTATGTTFLEWARGTSRSFEELNDELGAIQHQPAGTIRLSSNDYAATTLLPPVLADFCRQYPAIRIRLMTSNDPATLLKDDCELALHAGRAPDADFPCRKVLSYHRLLCASPRYLAGRPAPMTVSDLVQHDCITHTHGERASWSFERGGQVITQAIQPHIECDNFLSIIHLVRAGLGIARLADTLVNPAVDRGELVPVLAAYRCVYPDGGTPGTWLLFANRRVMFRTRLLADHIALRLGREATGDPSPPSWA